MHAKTSRLVVLVLAGVAALGCGDRSEEPIGGRPEGPTKNTVVVEGSVFTDFHVDLSCEEYSANQTSLPEELSGIALAFSDEAGEVVGQTSTGALQSSDMDYGCRFYATYQVSRPVSLGYRVDFDPPPPEDSGFYGAEELTKQEISSEDLEKNGFRWDFEAKPTYVVSDPPCAFDDTGCLAMDLIITVATDDGDSSASLSATAGIEANSWAQEGVYVPDTLDSAIASLGDPSDFPAVAPRFDLSTGPDTGDVEVLIRDIGGDAGESESLHKLELEAGQSEDLTLPAGIYVLSVSRAGSPAEAFHFGIRVP